MVKTLSFKPDNVISISGKRHSGKTVLAKYIVKQYVNSDIKVEIFDINNEYGELKHDAIIHKFSNIKDYRAQFNQLIDNAMRIGNRVLVLDDVDIIVSQNSMPDSLLECIQRGRHRGIGLILIFRRVNTMHKQVIFNGEHFFIFKSKFELDKNYLEDNLGSHVDISMLEPYEFLYLNDKDEEFTGKYDMSSDTIKQTDYSKYLVRD